MAPGVALESPPPLSREAFIEAAARVHTRRFAEFLMSAHDDIRALPEWPCLDFVAERVGPEGTRELDTSALVPASIAPRDEVSMPGRSVLTRLTYYAQDRITPIYASTAGNLRSDAAVALASVAAVVERGARRVYALTTEPGHHAGTESYGGFCYCNNAAIVAAGLADRLRGRVAVRQWRRAGSQLLTRHHATGHCAQVLDVDYHTGNGTMAIFWRDPTVFVASLHMVRRAGACSSCACPCGDCLLAHVSPLT